MSCGNHYTRIFPELARAPSTPNSLVEQGLIALGEGMLDNPKDRPKETPFAGYTYFGQFIDHDLTFDVTPLRLAGKNSVEDTPNFRSARLDLDQVYGGGPTI